MPAKAAFCSLRRPAIREAESAESQNRTGDTAIFSRVLYQLSYLGLNDRNPFRKAEVFYPLVQGLSSALRGR
jgi:hypothetical protein